MTDLSPEEQDILTSVESEEWTSVSNLNSEIERYKNCFQNSTELTEEIKIRLGTEVLNILKEKANQSGVSLQTLISHALQQYATSKLES